MRKKNICFKKIMTQKVILMKNIRMFWKINFEAINLVQKADLIKKNEKIIN